MRTGGSVVSRVAIDRPWLFTLSARLEHVPRPAERGAGRRRLSAERGAERPAERRQDRDRLSVARAAERPAERPAAASLQLSASTGPRPAERRRDRARIAAAQRAFTAGGRRAAGPVMVAELQICRYPLELSRIVRRALVYAHGLSRIGRQVHETRGSRVFIIRFLQNRNFVCVRKLFRFGPVDARPDGRQTWRSRVSIIQFLQIAARSLRAQFSRQRAPARRSRSGANPGVVAFQ